MKTQEEIEQLANKRYLQKAEAITDSTIKGFIVSATKGGYIDGYTQCQEDMADKKYTEEDMLGFLNFYNEFDFKKLGYRYRYPSMDGSEKKYNQNIDKKILEEYINSLNKQDNDNT